MSTLPPSLMPDEWYHSSKDPGVIDRFDPDKDPYAQDRDPTHGGSPKHWNSHLGTHFTSNHETAHHIGFTHGGRIYHATLDMKNPKHYASEFDLDREAFDWHKSVGNISWDKGPSRAENFLTEHPRAHELANEYKDHLVDEGHDGITYGNEYEEPRGHTCAIAFHPEQIHVTEHHLHQLGCSVDGRHCEDCGSPTDTALCHQCGHTSRLSSRTASEDYRMQHTSPGPDYGAPLHDLTGGGNIYPEDVYTHPHYYAYEPSDHRSWAKANAMRGKPDAKVRIYRALPPEHAHEGIHPGDWVSIDRGYAKQHGKHPTDSKQDWPVISATVPAKHVYTGGDSLSEWGYHGPETVGATGKPLYTGPTKDFSFSGGGEHQGIPGRVRVNAWDPKGEYAGHVITQDGKVEEHHVEPQHAHTDLGERLLKAQQAMPGDQQWGDININRTASADAGLPNPYHADDEFHHTWFHGTTSSYNPERMRGTKPLDSPNHYLDEDMAGSGHSGPQMNKLLGTHFSALRSVAKSFAKDWSDSDVFHARLKMKNPAYFPDEHQLDRHIFRHVMENHPEFADDEKFASEQRWQGGSSPRNLAERDRQMGDDHPRRTDLDQAMGGMLRWHPGQRDFAKSFVDSLKSQGHDGIVYGNNVEGPKFHHCAIAFHPDDIDVQHISHIPESPKNTEPGKYDRITSPERTIDNELDEPEEKIRAVQEMHHGSPERFDYANASRHNLDHGPWTPYAGKHILTPHKMAARKRKPVRRDPRTGLEKCHKTVGGFRDACRFDLGHAQDCDIDWNAVYPDDDGDADDSGSSMSTTSALGDLSDQQRQDLADHFAAHHPHLDASNGMADWLHKADHQMAGDRTMGPRRGQPSLLGLDHPHPASIDPYAASWARQAGRNDVLTQHLLEYHPRFTETGWAASEDQSHSAHERFHKRDHTKVEDHEHPEGIAPDADHTAWADQHPDEPNRYYRGMLLRGVKEDSDDAVLSAFHDKSGLMAEPDMAPHVHNWPVFGSHWTADPEVARKFAVDPHAGYSETGPPGHKNWRRGEPHQPTYGAVVEIHTHSPHEKKWRGDGTDRDTGENMPGEHEVKAPPRTDVKRAIVHLHRIDPGEGSFAAGYRNPTYVRSIDVPEPILKRSSLVEAGLHGELPGGLFTTYRNVGGKHFVVGHLPQPDGAEPKMIGHLSMEGEPGDESHPVSGAWVHPSYRRRGVAGALWASAKEMGFHPVHTPDEQTEDGAAWAQKVAGANGPDYEGLTFDDLDSPGWPHTHGHRLLRAHHPEHGMVGALYYDNRKNNLSIGRLSVPPEHQRRGVATQMMRELEARYPGRPIDHGMRSDQGHAWAESVYGTPIPENLREKQNWTVNGHEAAVRMVDAESSDGDVEGGIMIAVVPPDDLAGRLAIEDGEDPAQLHITLAYLGRTGEYEPQQLADLKEVVAAWAEAHEPLSATVQGAGTFVKAQEDGQHVLWASVDAPGLERMHVTLVDWLRDRGYDPRGDHVFIPHMTLSYEKHHVRFLPKIERETWTVEEVWVCIAGRWESVTLGSEEVTHERTAGRGKPRRDQPVAGAGGPAPDSVGGDPRPVGDGKGAPRSLTLHPKVEKEISRLHPQVQRKISDTMDRLSAGDPSLETHALTLKLKGWYSTKVDRGHRIIHQPDGQGGIYVGYAGLHDYDKAINRLIDG